MRIENLALCTYGPYYFRWSRLYQSNIFIAENVYWPKIEDISYVIQIHPIKMLSRNYRR